MRSSVPAILRLRPALFGLGDWSIRISTVYWTIVSIDTYMWVCAGSGGDESTRAGQNGMMEADVDRQCFGADDRPRRAAMVTRSGSESAFILRMT